ncbi:hypothetical protein H5410_003297 [Solanum commersonii]|uniref:Polyprotein protein n=1 Tax=Solanum commersonii TaxID=4109 RepID=A0A9J6B4P0_SOLCO|nr:hypothetical protein H5410_003297 [Solanum commersonii]
MTPPRGVALAKKREINITPTSSIDIWRIEVEYTREEEEKKRAAPIYSSQKTCESRQRAPSDVITLKVEVADLRKDVDYLKSIDFTSLYKASDDMDASTSSEMPLATTGNIPMVDVVAVELEAETDGEQLEVHEETIYTDLQDLEEMIIQLVI